MERDTNKSMMLATHRLVVENGCYEKAGAIMDYFLPERYEVKEHIINIHCSMDMLEKVKAFTKKHRYDADADKNVLLSVKIAKQLSDELLDGISTEKFSFEEISKIEKALNESKNRTKIYRTKDGQHYSLEPILNDGRYCSEKECDVAGVYSIPDQFNIFISGGRLRFDDFVYLTDNADNKGEPIIKIIKVHKGNIIEQFELKKVSEDVSKLGSLKLFDLDKKIEKFKRDNINIGNQVKDEVKGLDR